MAFVNGTDIPPGRAPSASCAVTAEATLHVHFCCIHLPLSAPAEHVLRRLTAAQLPHGGGGGGMDVPTDEDEEPPRDGTPNSIWRVPAWDEGSSGQELLAPS